MAAFRTLPVDAARLSGLIVAGPVRPVSVYAAGPDGSRSRTDVQATNPDGVPMWTVELATFTDDGLASMRVKFPAAAEPVLPLQAPATVRGLVAGAMRDGGFYFSADAVGALEKRTA